MHGSWSDYDTMRARYITSTQRVWTRIRARACMHARTRMYVDAEDVGHLALQQPRDQAPRLAALLPVVVGHARARERMHALVEEGRGSTERVEEAASSSASPRRWP